MSNETLVIRNPGSDTDNDYSDTPDSSFRLTPTNVETDEHTEYFNLSQEEPRAIFDYDDINWEQYMHEDIEEFSIDRQLRLINEEEQRAGRIRGRRLTAPAPELRPRREPSTEINGQLRTKQLALVNQQSNLHEIQIETAQIARQEAKEHLKMAIAQRKTAEVELQLKQQQLNNAV